MCVCVNVEMIVCMCVCVLYICPRCSSIIHMNIIFGVVAQMCALLLAESEGGGWGVVGGGR